MMELSYMRDLFISHGSSIDDWKPYVYPQFTNKTFKCICYSDSVADYTKTCTAETEVIFPKHEETTIEVITSVIQ